MAFYSCNRYRIIVIILVGLITFQIFRLLPCRNPDSADAATNLDLGAQKDIEKFEDGQYNKHKANKIKVRVYYEALCPDSKHFFIRHLGPITEKLYDFLDVVLVPYGKATTKEENGQYYFICQHGEEECFANKIHACSIEYLQNMTSYVKFTTCMIADNMDALAALNRCSKKMSVDSDVISECAGSIHGSELLRKYGDDTHIINPSFIPTIMVNGMLNNQAALLKNFLLEICKIIGMPLPPPCL